VSGKRKYFTITEKVIEEFLGSKRYRYEKMGEHDQIGIATGLAWTSVGGDTLTIEVNLVPGSGKLELTGQLGDVMKESARAAISYIRANAVNFGIMADFTDKNDIHIHVPEGATPKDGPSAGITLATALISALTKIPTKHNVAMTGEITLRGRVLPIGGLKEKVLAAHRAGIETVILPLENVKDLEDIPDNIRKEIKFHCVSAMHEVIETALLNTDFNKGGGQMESGSMGANVNSALPVHMKGGS
jgi:ATP-dependent Lon protease